MNLSWKSSSSASLMTKQSPKPRSKPPLSPTNVAFPSTNTPSIFTEMKGNSKKYLISPSQQKTSKKSSTTMLNTPEFYNAALKFAVSIAHLMNCSLPKAPKTPALTTCPDVSIQPTPTKSSKPLGALRSSVGGLFDRYCY